MYILPVLVQYHQLLNLPDFVLSIGYSWYRSLGPWFQFLWESISTNDQYVTQHLKSLDDVHLYNKASESPGSLLHVSGWVDSLIGPTGLLLLVSHLSAVPVQIQFYWIVVQGRILLRVLVEMMDALKASNKWINTWLPGTENPEPTVLTNQN